MKNYFKYSFVLVLLFTDILNCFAQNYVSIKNKKFSLNGTDFYPVGVNYIVDIVNDGSGGFYVTPHHGYGLSNKYESTDAISGLNNIRDDFVRMKTMGINSIRLVGLGPTKDPNNDGFIFKAAFNPIPLSPPSATDIYITPPYSGNPLVNPICAKYFSLINNVLALAADPAIDLKVTLLAGGGSAAIANNRTSFQNNENLTTAVGRIDYANYLTALADNFKTNTTLYAYDLFNEPGGYGTSGPNDGGNVSNKKEVCALISLWYDAIKTNDPNHLVTIGDLDPTDVAKWDPNIMKLDFVSFHPYPFIAPGSTAVDISLGINRVLSEIYWFGNNVNIPWMIGETGLTASLDGTPIGSGGVDGDFADQLNYATATLTAARTCGSMGYTWWQYQDVYWSTANQSNFGLIDRSDNVKPVVTAFQNFNPFSQQPQCTQPTNYYNAFGLTNPIGSVTGNVVSNGQPVKDAVVFGWNLGYFQFTHTFTKADGSYELRANFVIKHIRAVAISSNVPLIFDNNNQTGVSSPHNFGLNYASNYNKSVSNQTFTSSNLPQIYTALNDLNVTSLTIDGDGIIGGNVALKTGGVITLKEVTVKRGGEFHALYGTPFPDCNDSQYLRIIPSSENSNNSGNNSNLANGHQSFILVPENSSTEQVLKVAIYPNPSNSGSFEVRLSNMQNIRELRITDVYGRIIEVLKSPTIISTLNIAKHLKGIYFVSIVGKEKIVVKKIIYQ